MHQVLFIKLLLVYTYYLQTSPWQLAKTILVTAHYCITVTRSYRSSQSKLCYIVNPLLLLTYGDAYYTKYRPRLLLLLLLLLVYAQLLFSAVPPILGRTSRYFDHGHCLISCMEVRRRP